MCDYCNNSFGNNRLLKCTKKESEVEVDASNSRINIDYSGWDEYFYADVEINYCPMCGRKVR